MTPSLPVIEIHGDDVTVEASYLAARFDLSVDRSGQRCGGGSSTAWLSAGWVRTQAGYA